MFTRLRGPPQAKRPEGTQLFGKQALKDHPHRDRPIRDRWQRFINTFHHIMAEFARIGGSDTILVLLWVTSDEVLMCPERNITARDGQVSSITEREHTWKQVGNWHGQS